MKVTKTSNGSEKVADAFRSFLDADTGDIAQVLLEIEAPEPMVTRRKQSVSGELTPLPYSVEFPEISAETERQAVETARSLLDSMKVEYQFSPSARVFAATVTPDQLQKLVAEAAIRAVIPNRRVKM